MSLFTEYGKEKWQYVIHEYDIDSGIDSAVDVCVNDLEIKIDVYDNREQLEYSEVIMKWDGTVKSKKNVRILDDMRQRVHDFSMYTVKEFYTNDKQKSFQKRITKFQQSLYHTGSIILGKWVKNFWFVRR